MASQTVKQQLYLKTFCHWSILIFFKEFDCKLSEGQLLTEWRPVAENSQFSQKTGYIAAGFAICVVRAGVNNSRMRNDNEFRYDFIMPIYLYLPPRGCNDCNSP